MARRYGSSGSRCFNSYWGSTPSYIANYARTVIFLVVYMAILITLFIVRRRAGAGKRLIGLAFIGALSLTVIQYIFTFVVGTLSACDAITDTMAVYDTNIAQIVISFVQAMLLLFVVFYLLNVMLRKQLGQSLGVLRVVFGIDLLVLAVLLLTYTAMLCQYYYWSGRSYYRLGVDLSAAIYVSLAYDAFYILSVIGSGVLAVLAAKSLKRKNQARGSLLVWVVVLHFSLLVSAVWSLTSTAGQMSGGIYYGEVAYTVMAWISSIFYALAYVSVIVIARNDVWKVTGFVADAPGQQYAYHQEQPVYEGHRA